MVISAEVQTSIIRKHVSIDNAVLVLLYGIPVAASHKRPLFSFETSARPGDNRRQWKTTDDMVWPRRSLGRLRNGSLIDIFVDGPLGLRSSSFKLQGADHNFWSDGGGNRRAATSPPPLSWRQRRLKLTQTEAPLDPLERILGSYLYSGRWFKLSPPPPSPKSPCCQ